MFATAVLAVGGTHAVPSQYDTIQEAIDIAVNGDVVVVQPGRYYENINFNGKAITVRSNDPNTPAIVENTIIDGNQPADPNKASVVTFENGEGQGSVLAGFTIVNGQGTLVDIGELFGGNVGVLFETIGGGIYCYGSSPTITNCIIENNNADFGAGIYSDGIGPAINNPILTDCTFRNNSSEGFSGIYSSPTMTGCSFIANNSYGLSTVDGSPILTNCKFIGNSGGGVYCWSITLINCAFSGNSGGYGGGVLFSNGWGGGNTAIATNCTFSNNSARNSGGAIYAYLSNSSLTLTNCIIWGNTDKDGQGESSQIYINKNNPPVINNSCIQNLTGDLGGTGNTGDAPLFLDADGVDNVSGTIDDNLRIFTGSVCIDAGDNTELPPSIVVDLDGNPRIINTIVDMGVYEFGSYLVANAGADQYFKEIQPVTLDGSGSYFVNPGDVKQFEWTQTEGPAVELSDTSAMQPSFTPLIKAHYRFQLVINDSSNTSAGDEVLVVVGNQIPTADGGEDFFCSVGQPATLDGNGSYDPDPGDVITYSWRQLQGSDVVLVGADTAAPYFDCVEEGLYVFELVVNDGLDDSEPSTVNVTVYAPFPINTYTEGSQEYPAVAMDSAGNFVVVWRSLTNDGRGGGIYGQRFDAKGDRVGDELKINIAEIRNWTWGPSVAVHPSGSYVVVWGKKDIYGDADVVARMYDENDAPVTGEIKVNTYTSNSQRDPKIAMNSNGDFVVVYESAVGTGHDVFGYIVGQLYNAAGIPQGDEFLISQVPHSKKPDVAMDDSGDFVVTWLHEEGGNHIKFRRYNADGTPKADAVQIAEDVGAYDNAVAPSIAMNKDGDFVIAWAALNAFTQGSYPYEIYAQQFDNTGVPLGDPFMVNSYTDDRQVFASVAMKTEGQFVVVWSSMGQDGSDYGIFGQNFDSDGTPIDDEFRLNIYTLGRQWYPDVAMNESGKYVVVWESEGAQDGSGDGIFGKFGQFPQPSWADLAEYSYELVWQERLSRTEFEYCFQMRATNLGTEPIEKVTVELTSAPANITIRNSKVFFGLIPIGGEVLSDDTFIVRIDRNLPTDENDIIWEISNEMEADFSGDGQVNFVDFAYLAGKWLQTGVDMPEDLYKNEIIDFEDLAMFIENWLRD